MNNGLTTETKQCDICGATVRLGESICVSCFLNQGLEADGESSAEIFERILAEADVADTAWRIGNYKVIKEIGRGGMGAVFLAERADQQYQRRVAIKLVKRGMDTDAVLRQFRKERQILADLDHPNIGRLFDGGTTDTGLPYFVMEHIEGVPVNKYCDAHAASLQERLKLFLQVCAAVTYAHRHTVIHRDIKPSNILVTSEGVPKLVDFGIAKIVQSRDGGESSMTLTGVRPMTPEYASPEQVRGERVTPASDVYSLGVVLYELLTGHLPYRFASLAPHDIARAITEQEPTRPSTTVPRSEGDPQSTIRNPKSLRGDLDNILLMALRKEPTRRYQSVEQFADDIECHLEGRPIIARRIPAPARLWRWSRRNPVLAGAAVLCAVLASAVVWLARDQLVHAPIRPAPEKSIAVLPFQDLSNTEENAFFTAGVQEEILSTLAKIADLKVISRTSAMQYKDAAKRNLPEIAQQLGVAHVVEGSAQRVGTRVRVHAQLIDARTDKHIWAQTYDGNLADVFSVQSQIARAVADQLQAKISPEENRAIARPATTDVAANAFYHRALILELKSPEHENRLEAIRLLEQAVARDPKFVLAYCAMSRMHMALYFAGYDHTPQRRDLARAAIENAARIQPETAEVHLEWARHWYYGFLEYDRARAELELARRGLPNDVRVYSLGASMDLRQGRWSEATGNHERAVELDPRDVESLVNIAILYEALHRYSDAARMYERAAAIAPDDYFLRIWSRSLQALEERADLRPLRAGLDTVLAENPSAAPKIAQLMWTCATLERDRSATERAIAAIPAEGYRVMGNFVRPREWNIGYAARMFGDADTARRAFSIARSGLEKATREQPDYALAWSFLGRVDAVLGRKDDAIREGRRACELLPLSKDAWNGIEPVRSLAVIYAWTGEKDLAVHELEQLLAARVSGIDYSDLKLHPDWDALRDDPAFEQLVSRLAPGTAVPEKSIAVLPFQNLSGDPENAYFADGIQEEILTRLSKIADLKVISRTSTQRYRNTAEPLSTIASQLGVAHVLEGTVQKAADRVRVNVQLIKAVTDSHLWADNYDRKLTDIFAVESEVATKIADTLKAKLTGAEQHAVSYRPTKNTDAHELYFRARHLANSRAKTEDLLKAIDYYNQALAHDPNHAPAYAGLAEAYAVLPTWTYSRGRDALDNAKAAAKQALALDDNLAEAHIAMALVYFNDFDLKGSKQELERAIALDPNNAQAHYYLGRDILLSLGEFDRGIAEIKTALELDPLSVPMSTYLGVAYMFARHYPEAIAQLRKTIQFEPNFFFAYDMLGEVCSFEGRLDEALELWKHSYDLAGDYHSLTVIGYGYGLKGDRDKALQVLEQLQQLEKSGTPVWIYGYGLIYLALGDKDKAVECLERSWQTREPATPIVFIKVDPMLDRLRGDPRFERLANKIIPADTSVESLNR